LLFGPDEAQSGFFAASAQVIPVLLLALAIEARLFGSARRALVDHVWARRMEVLRQAIAFGTVVVLVAAEGQSLYLLRETSSADPWLTSIGLAWGFVTVAAIALRGTGRARVTADLKVTG
jgi:hypothetical protein